MHKRPQIAKAYLSKGAMMEISQYYRAIQHGIDTKTDMKSNGTE
jgi:hypothetical protein